MLTHINPRQYDIFVGIDTSKKSYSITHMDHQQNKHSFKSAADPEAVHQYFQNRFHNKRLLFIYEAGCTGYQLHDYLSNHNQDCIIVHPASVKHAAKDRVKNDRIDSDKLSDQGRGGQLRGIRVPDEDFRQLRHLATTRQSYAEDARRAKQRIKALLLFESIQLPQEIDSGKHWTKKYRQFLKKISVPNETVRFRLDSLLEDLEHAHQRLLWVHRQTREFCQKHEPIRKNLRILQSIPGFGFVVAVYFLSRIGDPANLRNVRELGSFVGVVPSEHSSGGKVHKGDITHMGDKELRRLLVQAAWSAIRKDKELEYFYNRIRTRNSRTGGPRIAIVAVARKLTARAHKVLKEQRAYIVH